MPTLLVAVGSTNVSTVKPTDANAGPRSRRFEPGLHVVDLVGDQDGDHVGLLGMGAWCGPRQHGSVAPGLTWGRTDNLTPRPAAELSVLPWVRVRGAIDGQENSYEGARAVGSDVVECSGTRSLRAWSVVVVAAVVMTFLAVEGSSAGVAPVVGAPGCTIVGTPGDDVLEGTPGDDVICGRGGDDRLVGRGGDDQLRGGRGDDELSGGGGDDLARGEQGKDVIKGGGGDDRLRGGKGNDQLDGRDAGAFTDIVRCGPGTADRAFADMGDDVVSGCEVVNQNDPPTDIRLEPATVAENSPVGTLVGTLEAKDPDPGDKHSFSLVAGPGGGDNGSFTIQGTQLLTAAALDFEVHAEPVGPGPCHRPGGRHVREEPDGHGRRCLRELSSGGGRRRVELARGREPDDAEAWPLQPGGQRHRRRRRHPVRDRDHRCRRRDGGDPGVQDRVLSDTRPLWGRCGRVRLHGHRRSRRLGHRPVHGRHHLRAGRPDRRRRRSDPRRGHRRPPRSRCWPTTTTPTGTRWSSTRSPSRPTGRSRSPAAGGADVRAGPGLLQRDPGHLRLHADPRWVDGDGVGHRDLRRRRADGGGRRGDGGRGQRGHGDRCRGQRHRRRRRTEVGRRR